jgi:hypothetical protein
LNLAGAVHPNAEAPHILGKLGNVGIRKPLELLHVARLAHVVALVAPLFLVQRVVVVDDGDGVDAIPHRRLQLPQMGPEATVAGEAHHGLVGWGLGVGQWRRLGALCLHQVLHGGVSRARLQQVGDSGDMRHVAEVVDQTQAFFDLPVT